ncbi:MAG TPA: hypothetical protein VLN26_02405 [Gaiellaceae bacterium]|nr:hypothetical protein [Gaiellaceae bacterium]
MIPPKRRYEACELVPSRGAGHVLRVVAIGWTAGTARRRARRRVRGTIAVFDTLTRTWLG